MLRRRRTRTPETHSLLSLLRKPFSHFSSDDDPTDHICYVLVTNPKWRRNHSLNALIPFLSSCHVSSILSRPDLDPITALNFFDHLATHRNRKLFSSPSHVSLLDSLVPARLFFAAERVFLSMIAVSESAEEAQSVFRVLGRHSELKLRLSVGSYNSLMSLLSRFSMSNEMKLVFKDVVSPDLNTFNAMIGKVSDAKMYLSRLFQAGFVPDEATYASLVSGYCERGDFETARRVFDQMLRRRLQSSEAYESLVVGFCGSGWVEKALGVFLRIEMYGCSPTLKTCNVLVRALCDSGRRSEALALFQEISEPDEETYTILVDSLCSGLDFDAARNLANEAVKRGLGLRVSSFNAIVEGYCRTGSVKTAREVMKSMITRPDSRTFEVLICGFCQERQVGEATDLLSEMVEKNLSPNAVTYSILIRRHCEESNLVIARELLGSMKENGLSPDESVYGALVVALAKSGDLESAAKIFGSIFERSEAVFDALVNGYCKAGKTQEALALFEEMLGCGFCPSVSSYAALAKSSKGILESMFDKYVKPCVDLYGSLVEESLKRRDFDGAEDILDQAISAGLKPNSSLYDSLVGALCGIGELERAESVVAKMKKEGTLPNAATYFLLLNGYARFRSIDRSFGALESMIGANLDPPQQAYLILVDHLANHHRSDDCSSKTMEFEDALKLFEELEKRNIKPPRASLYESLVIGLCENKRLKAARRLYEHMIGEGISPTGNTYNALFGCFCESGFFKEAIKLVDTMIDQGHLPSLDHSAQLLCGLCEEEENEESREKVMSVFRDLLACGKYESSDEMAWKVLINGLLERGHVDVCFELFCEMDKKNGLELDPETYSVLLGEINKEYWNFLFNLIS